MSVVCYLTFASFLLQVRGEDNVAIYKIVGYPLSFSGPPSALVWCDANDEISTPLMDPYGKPAGCQSEQEQLSLRVYWQVPTETGYILTLIVALPRIEMPLHN